MKKRKIPFLKCCEWLYQGALSAGILFVLQGFLQEELKTITAFPEAEELLKLMVIGVFAVQLLLCWSGEKGYRIQTGLGLLAVNIIVGFLFMEKSENRAVFWCYVGLEAACIVSATVVYVIRHFAVMKGLLILAQAISLVVLAVLEKAIPGWCVCIILIAILLFLAEIAAKRKKEVLGLLPLFASALLLLCLLPRQEKPLSWNWVEVVYTTVQEKAEMLLVDVAYLLEGERTFSLAGYEDEGGLGGFVFDNDQEKLRIAGGSTKNPLYLTGAVYDVYTEDGWKATSQQMKEKRLESEQEGIQNALKQSVYAEEMEKLTSSCLISVEYRFVKTTDFFHDLHTTNIYFPEKDPKFKKADSWTMENARGKDFTYQLRFLEINEKSDEIKALLRQQAWKEDAVWDNALKQHESEIYKIYTQLPDTLPKRVYELAHTVSADSENDYDKMMAFVDYLKDYDYTKTPPICPDGQEFTDYFLFDSKSGYCTYFATALAVLGRCEEIPTRYVNGFMTTGTCKNANGNVTITGEQAHAWVEVYIEHVGWVRFDATPGYGDVQTDRWNLPEVTGTHDMENPFLQEDTKQENLLEEVEEQEQNPEYALLLLKVIVTLLISGILVIALIVWLRNIIRSKKYAHADTQEKVRLQIKRLLRLGKLQGVAMLEEETLQAYQERVCDLLDVKEYSFAKACTLYEGICFGDKTVSPRELKELEAYVEKAERCYLACCGFLRKLVYHIM